MWWVWNILAIIAINVLESRSIQNLRTNRIKFVPAVPKFIQPIPNNPQISFKDVREPGFTRNFRHTVESSNFNFDWENGLREATTQALIKEGSRDINLRKHIFSAPILGKEEKATPFGDIAVLARGQLYITPRGYIFNQDPYQNDCDGCHNEYARNEIWRPRNSEQLMALWTVRRIRHRPVQEDNLPRFEIEFTVSPINHNHRVQGQITDEGHFNYAIPGHVFLMKSDNHQTLENHYYSEKQGTLIAQSPDGRKYILQNFAGVQHPRPVYHTSQAQPLPQYHPVKQTMSTPQSTTGLLTDETLTLDEEKKIYQALLDILHKKTSTIQPQVMKPAIQESPNIPTTQISDTTLVQLPDGHLVPITELSSPFITRTTQGFVTVRFPDTTTPENSQLLPTSTQKVSPQKMSTVKPFLTHMKPSTTYKYSPQTTSRETTTTPPPKTTFHFFSAAEDNDDMFVPTSKQSTTTQFLPDTNLAQSQDTATTIKQSTARTTVPVMQFSTVSKKYVTSQLPTTILIPSIEVQKLQPSKIPQATTPMHVLMDDEKQFSTVRPASTPKTSIYLNEYSTETEHSEEPEYSLTAFTRPITTELASSRIPTTVLIRSSSPKITTHPVTDYAASLETSTKISSAINKDDSPKVSIGSPEVQYGTTTPSPTENLVETTLGVTKVMSTITNDTPGTIFIVSEPAEENVNTQNSNPTEKVTTYTTNSVFPTKAETQKHIITTIGADGSVSVKTTPILTSIRTSTLPEKNNIPTRKFKPKTTTEKSNFLLETDLGPSKSPEYKDSHKDYSADDIFGTTPQSVTKSTAPKKVYKPYTTSDVELALFGKDRYTRNFRKSRRLKYINKNSLGNSTTEKIKYSSSYTSTTERTTKLTEVKTTTPLSYTSQSVLTSISYKINKRKNSKLKNKDPEPTNQPILTTTVTIQNHTEKYQNKENQQPEFDEFASKLLSQARGIEFLNEAPAATVKASKYMRQRSYTSKSKRPTKKKKVSVA